ncbi:MAG: WYL domain-containing protein [Alphaproteobacteria bacterium]|nr:WYL domain-containing protein [Alphaproteobacteria bacterium]MCB9699929.1 WYL domain-containing protein [Alphaproteobacteria bacterium]
MRVVRDDLAHLARRRTLQVVGKGIHRRYTLHKQLSEEALPPYDRMSLLVGREVTRFLRETPAFAASDAPSELLHQRVRYVSEPARSYAGQTALVDRLLTALVGTKAIRFTYDGPSGPKPWPSAWPLLLMVYRRALFLVVRAGRRDYTLSVDRMGDLEVLGRFEWPTDWDPDAWLDGRFGIVATADAPPEPIELEFTAEVAHLVRARRWHPSQELTTLRDGRVRLTMMARGMELVRFVMEWGDTCKVIGPASLREEVIGEHRRALAAYGEEP